MRAQTESLEPALSQAIARVVNRGDFILGGEVEDFEGDFAAFCGVAYAIGVDSGFSALELGLRAQGVGRGDEVLTQANTFIATVGAVLAVGARPILVDCDPEGAITPEAIAAAITPRTRAILPVHLFGLVGQIDAIVSVADSAGIVAIEDACQAHGALFHGRRAGSFGVSAAFSFYPTKNLGGFGDGGMLVTDSDQIAATVRTLRNYGQRAKYEHVMLPLNRRLDTIQAAVLRVKLAHVDGWNARRQYLADAYREHLAGLPIKLPRPAEEARHVYHLFPIQAEDRDALRATLADHGIETGIHYPLPVHLQPAMEDLGYRRGAFANAERLAATSVSLPMYPELTLDQIERVASVIRGHYAL